MNFSMLRHLLSSLYVPVRHESTLATHNRVFLASIGNPEPEYALTRHNIGHRFIDHLVTIYWKNHVVKTADYYTSTKYPSITIFKSDKCLMNVQGRPISKHFNRFKNSELIIVQDDLENDVGRYKIRAAGTSPRGHNGLKSVIQHLGNHHRKLAIGIGKTPPSQHMAQHVLGKFDPRELEIIDYEVFPKVVEELEKILDPPKRRQKRKTKEKSKKNTESGKTASLERENVEIDSKMVGNAN